MGWFEGIQQMFTNVRITSHVQISVHPNPTIDINRKFRFACVSTDIALNDIVAAERAVTHSQYLDSTQGIHIPLISQCAHIAGRNKALLCILFIVGTCTCRLRVMSRDSHAGGHEATSIKSQ